LSRPLRPRYCHCSGDRPNKDLTPKSEEHNTLTRIMAVERAMMMIFYLFLQKQQIAYCYIPVWSHLTLAMTDCQTVAHPAVDVSDILIVIVGQSVERDSDPKIKQRKSTKKRCLSSAKLRSTDCVNPRTVLSRVRPRYRHLL
jgi:hypothetical protein